ncbi:o-succinylbenzoate--CoA ligase [Sporosarcina contaminans]|uniref:2-succinylbenzoate--CoA ligase n=1 Tax=Sporosarcina contaminans TaxID=633403 RepID=A0ABW3TXP2_9BACL
MIPNWLLQRAYLTPDRVALSFEQQQWTFQELHDEAMRIARKLYANGLREGTRVALLGPSNAHMMFMIHGCLLGSIEIVMINSRLSEKEIAYQLLDSEAEAIIVEDSLAEKLQTIDRKKLLFSFIASSEEIDFTPINTWKAEQTITIMYTSGTTGFPKGVRQTVGNHTSNALSSVLNLGLSENDVWLCTTPLFHISGFSIIVRSLLYGMGIRLYEKFDAIEAAEEIQKGSVTRMSVVANSLDRILREMEKSEMFAHPNFQTMLAGGGPLPIDYLRRAEKRGIAVLQTYGMTETSSQTATLSADDALRKIGSAGKPLFFNQIKIRDAEKPMQHGEVMIAGPHVTPGYVGRFADRNPLEDGWLPTGDIGYMDHEGYLYIVDRRSDLIISGGENIYPAEIENVLVSHPSVLEAGVCGQEDEKWGSVPIAFLVCKEPIEKEEIEKFCLERLAKFKVPKSFYMVDELPRNASNKLMRRELKHFRKRPL